MTPEPRTSDRTPRPRGLGVCSWSLQPATPSELLTALEGTGLEAVQLSLLPLVEEPRIWANSVQVLRDQGIRILSGMFSTTHEDYSTLETIRETGGVRPDAHWPETLDSAMRVANLAEESTIRLLSFHAGFIPHDRGDSVRETTLHRLRQIVDLCAERGVSIALETGQETAATILDVLEELDRPDVGINFDPANMILYGMGDPIDGLRLLADRTVQIHVKDALPAEVPGTWGSEVPVGSGAVDWSAFFDVVEAMDRPVDLVIEREAGDARVADIITARKLIEDRFPMESC
jgi:L-ribulose-5-phosphate 3-epimerase